MSKTILFLVDGAADDPLPELGGKTPIEYAATPSMDRIAREGASGTFLTLPEGHATSSDVANMSVLGYDLDQFYCGRGPLEAMSQGIDLQPTDVAFRCNLVYADGDTLVDYSGGHIAHADSVPLMKDLAATYNCDAFSFYPGVSYRNLLVLHGAQFCDRVAYNKPDASQGMHIPDIVLRPRDDSPEAAHTAAFVNQLQADTRAFLEAHPINADRKAPANLVWPWSPGHRPAMTPFAEKYGARGAIISAVDVIFGLGVCADMEIIHVEGATGFVDTNYEGKADAAVEALARNDFVYVHVEAIDECGHMGDLPLKMQAIEDVDRRLMARVFAALEGQDITYAVLPDHPVPVHQRIHTRDPVPVSICGAHITPDACETYSERVAPTGSLGFMKGDELMRKVLNCS
jgi:2,3-bisphosphoglycerate-independent phosphoglycerate mutase